MIGVEQSPIVSAWSPPPEFTYLSNLDEQEYALGFRYRKIASSPGASISRRILTVVFSIDASNRIVKIYDPLLNRAGYLHQCFGVGRRMKGPAWRPVQLTFPDAKMALRSWQNGQDNRESSDAPFCHIEAVEPRDEEY